MKLRLPIYAKVIGWFFLNLALLGVVAWLLVRSSFTFGLDSALLAHGEDRVQAMSGLVIAELRERPATEWDEILSRFSKAYQVSLRVYGNLDGTHIAGPKAALPAAVQAKVADRRGELRPGGPDGRRGPPGFDRPFDGNGPPERLRDFAPPPRNDPPLARESGRPIPTASPPMSPKYFLRTDGSPSYWLIIREELDTPSRRRSPVSLIAASDSLGFNGLLMDFRPWLAAVGAAALLSGLFWLPLVRHLTHSIAQMRDATRLIAEGRFDVRVDEKRGDELGALGHSVNQMAERLAGLVAGQKRFLGDIAHELCSPLAKLRVSLGILETRATDDKQRHYVATANEKAEHMANLVNELLSFSKASIGTRSIQLQPVALREIADTAARREAADGAQITVEIANELRVQAEPELLTRALANLLRNAVRYAGDAGPITVTASQRNGDVLVSVSDHGPGIPESELTKVFDPFYRLDSSRDRQTGGVGLGLAIVKTCIDACGGTVAAHARAPHGLQVDLKLKSA